jgi:O-antigen biosynthesis protein WbqP
MRIYPIIKRFGDLGLAIFLLLFLFPLYLLLALIIRLQDGGPAIFKQKRIGRNGEEFIFYKFRSMPVSTPNVESRETQKLRITQFGKFIRRTNLDELPQVFNVLKGDMSFIGPRPPICSQKELIKMRRVNGALAIKPGLTGWAQVNSYDGMPPEHKASFDGEYARLFSITFDLLILIKTVSYFFKKPPTY